MDEFECNLQVSLFVYEVDNLVLKNHKILKGYWDFPTYKESYKNAPNLMALQTNIKFCDDYLEKARFIAGTFNDDGYNNISTKSKLEMLIDNLKCVKNRCEIFHCLLSHSEKFSITTHGNEAGYIQNLNDDESCDKIDKLCDDVEKWINKFERYIL